MLIFFTTVGTTGATICAKKFKRMALLLQSITRSNPPQTGINSGWDSKRKTNKWYLIYS